MYVYDSVRIWSILTGQQINEMHSSDHRTSLLNIADEFDIKFTDYILNISCDSKIILAGGSQGQVLIWNRDTGIPLRVLLIPYPSTCIESINSWSTSAPLLLSHPLSRPPISCISIKEELIAVGAQDNISIWDTCAVLTNKISDEENNSSRSFNNSLRDRKNGKEELLLIIKHSGVRQVNFICKFSKVMLVVGGKYVSFLLFVIFYFYLLC